METSPASQDINHMAFFVKVQLQSERARASSLTEPDNDGPHDDFSDIDSLCDQEVPRKGNSWSDSSHMFSLCTVSWHCWP